jgi:hypothetical protein
MIFGLKVSSQIHSPIHALLLDMAPTSESQKDEIIKYLVCMTI